MTLPSVWRVVPAPRGRLYEGARWLPDEGIFQWVDILGHAVVRWDPTTEVVEVRTLPLEFVTVALPMPDGRQLVTSRQSVHAYDWRSGDLQLLATLPPDPTMRFNDGGLSPRGEFYLGTMSMTGQRDAGSLYRLEDSTLVETLSGIGISNGLSWADPDTAYYVDSVHPQVDVLRWSSEGIDRQLHLALDIADEPDGLTVTDEGDLMIAIWRGSRLIVVPSSSQVPVPVPVPAVFPTSVACGGRDGDLVLVTTADHQEAGVASLPGDGLVFVANRNDVIPRDGENHG